MASRTSANAPSKENRRPASPRTSRANCKAKASLPQGQPYVPLKFRQGDYWQELAEELNLAIEALKQHSAEGPADLDHDENSCPELLETVAN